MSRKSSWWLRPQRKGASNRAALNEANYFMEHNKVLRERIKELAAENAKLREFTEEILAENTNLRKLVRFVMHQCNDGNPRCDGCIDLNGGECVALQRMREAGIEVNW